MAWSAYLFQTVSGQIGPQLKFESAKWSMSLNDTESFSFDLRKSDLPNVDLNYWLAPWWAGVVYMWDDIPIVAGPIISRRSESFNYVYIDCAGIRAILARRFTVREQTDWTKLAASAPITFSGLSLGTIAKEVVKVAMKKPGGGLPITFPIADQGVANDADHQRTYRPFNLANINCDDVLTKLSDVIDGPDIMFRPRLITSSRLTFDMWHGTEDQPRIAQQGIPVWDTTAVLGGVTDMDITATGAYQSSRVYSVGAGTDEGKLIRVNTDLSRVENGFPLLETTINSGNSDSATVVANHGKATLRANRDMIQEMQMQVDGAGFNPIGTFWPGEQARLAVKGWISIKDGIHDVRLLNINGDDTAQVRISAQTEDQFLNEDNTREDYAV